jgi:CRISPR-associated protein Cmr3
MPETLTFDPVDVLLPRGNRLFGGGVHGHAQMPPWPSLFAGAIASRALADAGRITNITYHPDRAETILGEVLGSDFSLTGLGLVRGDEALFPLPADLLAFRARNEYRMCRVEPRGLADAISGISTSGTLPRLPVLDDPSREKPESGLWITVEGLAQHLAGEAPRTTTLVPTKSLWKTDPRLGIALDAASRTAAESRLYTSDAVALCEGVRFLAGFDGRNVPREGLVRLGGDGRGAHIAPVTDALAKRLSELGRPQPDWMGFRMCLATPGIFPDGWLPPGVDSATRRLQVQGLTAELVSAAIPRHEIISGWDMANHVPKPARKVAPAGSVYWFRVLEGDTAALASVRQEGLWPLMAEHQRDPARWREGFNRVWFGAWKVAA